MWGKSKKSPGGYTDTVYRSRQTAGFESKSRCCCFYFTRSVVILILAACLASAGGLSVVSIVFGYSQRWTYNVNRNNAQVYSIRTGWLYFSDSRMVAGAHLSMRELAKAPYILGIIAFIMSSLSVIFALFFGIRSLCGRVGRGFVCFSVIFSILLIVSLGGYYIITALEVWKRESRLIGTSRIPWPDWAWGLGAGSALAWFIAAGFASVLPKRHKYLDADREFEPSGATTAARSYTPPTQSTPTNLTPRDPAYEPSSPVPAMPNGTSKQPMAAQENPTRDVEEGKKKGFVPSWSRKSAKKSELPSPNGSAFDAPPGSYRSRAEEVANRYRSRDRSGGASQSTVEMAPSAPPASKGAWG